MTLTCTAWRQGTVRGELMEKLRMPFLTKVVVVAALYYRIVPRRPQN
jgi:hypothetical protein